MKELAKKFKNQFLCLGEKNIIFTVLIEEKVKRINKNGEEIAKNISHILQLIVTAKFMAYLVSNLPKNYSEGIHRIKCKYEYYDAVI